MAKKSYSILPGLKLNRGKNGFTSLTVGKRGSSFNIKLDTTPPSPEERKIRSRKSWRALLRGLSFLLITFFGVALIALLTQNGPTQYQGISLSALGIIAGILLWKLGNRIMRNI